MNLPERWQLQLAHLESEGRRRSLAPAIGIDFSSNDYLGYSNQPWPDAGLPRSGTASRLLRGQHAIWDEVEARLADWHGAEAALMMTSGYVANEGLLSTIIEPGDTVFSDQNNHASIIDGLRLSRAEKIIFAHNDLSDLESRLRRSKKNRTAHGAWFIVTESLFGMDGDLAPLRDLADLAERFDANLIVDEAHATGCFGDRGGGLVDALGLRDRVLATMHTGGKALAVPGAYIVGSKHLRESLINRCRHLIYTTALPPEIGAWWRAAIAKVLDDAGTRTTLHENARRFRNEALRRGVVITGSEYVASIVVGADGAAVSAARYLQDCGFDVRAIRPPTVPSGTARLRVSIHADHDVREIDRLVDTLTRSLILSS